MFGLYITHPQVTIDPAVPVPQWGLSAIGAARAREAAAKPWMRMIRRIVSSAETKAVETAADRFFAHPDQSFEGWERASDAQARIVAAVETVMDGHDPSLPIAFVGHGGVGTLLRCHLLGRPISRAFDQPAGGGNLYAFTLADRRLACDWTAIEDWKGIEP